MPIFDQYTIIPTIINESSNTESVTILILVGAGSRYEDNKNSGVAHFLEHMFFKGGEIYKTAKDVSMAIDAVGGMHNAFTDKEVAGYYVKIAKEHIETGFKVLSDMLENAIFPNDELEKERGVIIEELKMYQDMPSTQVGNDFERLIYGDQPLGWDVGGSIESVSKIVREDLLKFQKKLYSPDNMVISVSGNTTKKEVEDLVKKYFIKTKGRKEIKYKPYKEKTNASCLYLKNKETDQVHLVYGMQALPRLHPLLTTLKVLSTAFGGPSSSRLFQTMREEKGLCYYIGSGYDTYDDAGSFYIRSGVSVERVFEALDELRNEYSLLFKNGISSEELTFAKEFMKGSMALNMEDSESQAFFYAHRQLLLGEIKTIEQVKEEIDSVSLDNVYDLLSLFKKQSLYLSMIGPFAQENDFQKYILPL